MNHHQMNIHNILSWLIEDGIVCEDNFRPYPLVQETYKAAYKQALIDFSIWKDGVQRIGAMDTDIKIIMKEIESELSKKEASK